MPAELADLLDSDLDALAIHPQSVRYRLAQLRELFGGALDDPGARFEPHLTLRGR